MYKDHKTITYIFGMVCICMCVISNAEQSVEMVCNEKKGKSCLKRLLCPCQEQNENKTKKKSR